MTSTVYDNQSSVGKNPKTNGIFTFSNWTFMYTTVYMNIMYKTLALIYYRVYYNWFLATIIIKTKNYQSSLQFAIKKSKEYQYQLATC